MTPAWALTVLIILHTVEGRDIAINVEQIVSLRETKPDSEDNKYFVKGVRCMVATADGKYTTVAETCAAVRALIEGAPR